MKHLLLLSFIFILTKTAFALEDQKQSQAGKRSLGPYSRLGGGGGDMTQIFLENLKILGDQRVNHKISREEYSARLGQIREALIAKKRSEELDAELMLNTLRQSHVWKNVSNDKISGLDKMLNILDKLDILVNKKTTTPDILTKIEKALALKTTNFTTTLSVLNITENKIDAENAQALLSTLPPKATKSPPQSDPHLDRPRNPHKHPTERDVSKYQFDQNHKMLPSHKRCLNQEEGCEHNEEDDPNDEYDQEITSSKPGGFLADEQHGSKRFKGHTGQKLHTNVKSSSGKLFRTDEDLAGNDTSDVEYKDNGNNEDKVHSTETTILDRLILLMVAIVTTQLCLIGFLLVFKDKVIASLTLKYGQIKVTW